MRDRAGAVLAFGLLGWVAASGASDEGPGLPKVVLAGDSIRLGYAPGVAGRLAGRATVVSPPDNGGDSANVLEHLEEWIIRQKPDVVHLNCGLHDLKRSKADGRHQVEPGRYEANLRRIAARVRDETGAALVFASTTPILDDRHTRRGADFDRTEADVRRYNAAASSAMREAGVPVDDLHWVVEEGGLETMLGPDGVHLTAAGSDRLAEAVADCVLRQLAIAAYRPLPEPASGPAAAESYREAVAGRDRQVPELYRRPLVAEFHAPDDADDWKGRRPAVLDVVEKSLGDLPGRPSPPRARVISREIRRGYTMEKVAIDNGVDGEVTSLLLIPEGRSGRVPAILWLHSSSPDKTQVLIPNTNGGASPLGEAFVKAGYAVMAPDAYWHGDRAGTGPSGAGSTGRAEQEDLFKRHLWLGRTLWGMFVRDDRVALDYLCSRPEVDPARIGATGMSMGSTRAWWLAAVDERVAAVVAVACLTRYQELMAHGDLRQHGVYYFVDGLLKHFDTEGVLALIAPRPFLALTGDLDAGSPADGVRTLERIVGRIYEAIGAKGRFRSVLYPEVGHAFTPGMRAEMMAWFDQALGPPTRGAVAPKEVVRLFNGKDLAGLTTWLKDTKGDDPRKVFRVTDDGLLHIGGDGFGYAATREEYRDYRLVVEYKWGKKTDGGKSVRNSGILLHATGPDGGAGGTWMASVECQLAQGCVGDLIPIAGNDAAGAPIPVRFKADVALGPDKRPRWSEGGGPRAFTDGQLWWSRHDPDFQELLDTRGRYDVESPLGEWTRVECVCDGGRIAVSVNGQLVNRSYDAAPAAGKILLQSEGFELFVRRFELHPLSK